MTDEAEHSTPDPTKHGEKKIRTDLKYDNFFKIRITEIKIDTLEGIDVQFLIDFVMVPLDEVADPGRPRLTMTPMPVQWRIPAMLFAPIPIQEVSPVAVEAKLVSLFQNVRFGVEAPWKQLDPGELNNVPPALRDEYLEQLKVGDHPFGPIISHAERPEVPGQVSGLDGKSPTEPEDPMHDVIDTGAGEVFKPPTKDQL